MFEAADVDWKRRDGTGFDMRRAQKTQGAKSHWARNGEVVDWDVRDARSLRGAAARIDRMFVM